MEKAKYKVYIMYNLARIYVTTTRNCEDMIFQIRQMHESPEHNSFKITRQVAGEKEKVVYTMSSRKDKSWESEFYK